VGAGLACRPAYGLLVAQPRQVEERLHAALADASVSGDRYRCSTGDAIAAIRQAAMCHGVVETYNLGAVRTSSRSHLNSVTDAIRKLRQDIDALAI